MRVVFILLLLLGLNACGHKVTYDPRNDLSPEQAKRAALVNVQLAVGYLEQGDRERAKSKLNRAFSYGPELADVHMAYAYFYEKNVEIKKAQRSYLEAVKLSPNNGAVNNNYGAFLCKHKKYKEAIGFFMKAVKDPEYTTVANAYENAGLCANRIPDPPQAVHFFTKALQHDPKRSKSLFAMAELSYFAGAYGESKSFLKKYLELEKPTPDSLLLSAKLAKHFKDKNTLATSELLLKHKYPKTKAYQKFKQLMQDSGYKG